MLGLTTSTYTKRYKNVRNFDYVNKQLADARLSALGNQNEQPINSQNMEIHDPKEYHLRISALIRKKEELWSVKLGTIGTAAQRIKLIPGATTLKSAPYRAGTISRKLEEC